LNRNHPAAYRIKVAPTDHVDWSGDVRDRINRGAIEEVGPGILDEVEDHERWGGALKVGNIVYYNGGMKISDSIFIETTDIIAYEEPLDENSSNGR
jgi:hypothetical protein